MIHAERVPPFYFIFQVHRNAAAVHSLWLWTSVQCIRYFSNKKKKKKEKFSRKKSFSPPPSKIHIVQNNNAPSISAASSSSNRPKCACVRIRKGKKMELFFRCIVRLVGFCPEKYDHGVTRSYQWLIKHGKKKAKEVQF